MKVSEGLLRLRMEYDITDLEKDMRPAFRKNGNVKVCDTITRDIVVPSTETLCQMHFIIQKSFNWLWYHMHDFCFTDEDFEKIAKDEEGYRAQMGTLFSARMDEDEQEERTGKSAVSGSRAGAIKSCITESSRWKIPSVKAAMYVRRRQAPEKSFMMLWKGSFWSVSASVISLPM